MKTYCRQEISRGDIYYADLRPVIGSEQGGIRPVLILQNNVGNRHSPTVIAAPITSKMGKPRLPTHVCLNMRGQVFDFGGLTWFTMGGAASHDIQDGILDPADPDFEHRYWLMRRMRSMFRVKGVSWWAEEMPSQAEYQEALANLERVNWTVDCVLTHCAPSGVVQKINPSYGTDELTDFLEMVSQRCKFAYWFFGHYHENRIIDQKYILQWEKISELGF